VRHSGESHRGFGAPGITGLHTISNNMGVDGFGMGLMLEAEMIASHIGSYVGENRRLETLVLQNKLNQRMECSVLGRLTRIVPILIY
jgi:acyl CoA:acetate/3-ketoacid CoA transferase alpha subunit